VQAFLNLIILKLILTPLFIAALTLAGRRWGPAASGALAGLPLTSGSVSVFLVLEQGRIFAAHAAVGTLAGLIGVGAFCVAYFLTARGLHWLGAALAGLVAFCLCTIGLDFLALPLWPAFGAVLAFLVVALFAAGRSHSPKGISDILTPTPATPSESVLHQILPRAAVATALVLLLTGVAPALGAHLTGLLSPFPVFGAVLTIFAHRQSGLDAARRVLRGLLVGSIAFAAFFFVVGGMIERSSLLLTYLLASMSAVLINAVIFALLRERL
jgi:hypothetical protein